MRPFLETMLPMWLGCLPAQAQARLACLCFKWPALGPGSTSISFSASRLYPQKYFRQKLQTNVPYKYNPRLFYYIDLNWRLSSIVVNPHQELLANTLGPGSSCYFLNMHFFLSNFKSYFYYLTFSQLTIPGCIISSHKPIYLHHMNIFILAKCIFATSLASSQSTLASQSDAF